MRKSKLEKLEDQLKSYLNRFNLLSVETGSPPIPVEVVLRAFYFQIFSEKHDMRFKKVPSKVKKSKKGTKTKASSRNQSNYDPPHPPGCQCGSSITRC